MMFRAPPNPFDEIVTKATDENLTSENWELILEVCDKVDAKPEDGPRDAVLAVTKRFAHRNANVQLYSLTLAESLGKNCGTKVHRELASKAFTQALLRLINDRTTHATVKSRAYELITQWTEEFKNDPSLSIMDETLRQLKASNPSIQPPSRPSKREITDADRKKEEEELQMALALSLSDTHITQPSTSQPQSVNAPQQQQQQFPKPQQQPIQKQQTTAATVSRVKALYDFSPSEPSELPFRRGDIISVLDSVYKDWWRGSLRGQTGIFPVNYVEILRDPTPEELMREAEEEAKILAEGRNIEKLLGLLANADGGRGVEDEELQRLYNTTLSIRPKLVKLIEKYSMRKDELIALNEKFHKARHDYDVLMESSMSRYSRPAPNPSTNPFGQIPQYQSGPAPFQPNRPLSSVGFIATTSATPPPSAPGYPTVGTPSTAYPPAPPNWEGYQQPKPWEAPGQPPPQPNPWETQHPQQTGQPSQWEGQPPPHDNLPGQWDNQYQQWDQDRPGAPATSYPPPTQHPPVHHYGGGLDELASPVTGAADKPQQGWYDAPSGPPPGAPSGPNAPFPTTNVGAGGFITQTSSSQPHSYFTPPPQQTKPDIRQDPTQQLPYPEQPASYPPPPPTQAPPAIPFDQKPQTPYPVGKGRQFYAPPKPPATYNQQGPGDKYSSLRSLSAASDHEGSGDWYGSSPAGKGAKEEDVKSGNGGNSGYYGVST